MLAFLDCGGVDFEGEGTEFVEQIDRVRPGGCGRVNRELAEANTACRGAFIHSWSYACGNTSVYEEFRAGEPPTLGGQVRMPPPHSSLHRQAAFYTLVKKLYQHCCLLAS